MKTAAFLLGLAFLIGADVFATDRVPGCPRVTSIHELSTGQRVELPLCTAHSNFVSILTLGDLEAVNKMLSPLMMYAVPVQGKALLSIAAIEYKTSSLGPYNEAFVSVMASPIDGLLGGIARFLEFSSLNPLGPPTTHGAVVLKIWVDQELPLIAGNEIWGFNKSRGTIRIADKSGLEIRDENSELILNASWSDAPRIPLPFGQYLDFFTITNLGLWARAKYTGHAWFSRSNSETQIQWGRSDWGRALDSIRLKPQFLMNAPNAKLHLFRPLNEGTAADPYGK